LTGERAEFTACRIPNRLAGRLAHATVGEPDAGRVELGQPGDWFGAGLTVVEHALGIRGFQLAGKRGEGRPAQAGLVAEIVARADVVHLVAGHPLTLVVAIEEVALRAEVDAVGGAQARGPGYQLSSRRDLHAPAAPGRPGLVPAPAE